MVILNKLVVVVVVVASAHIMVNVVEESRVANFINEWSPCDCCFTNFGVKNRNEKKHFQTFQRVFLSCIHCREGYTK